MRDAEMIAAATALAGEFRPSADCTGGVAFGPPLAVTLLWLIALRRGW